MIKLKNDTFIVYESTLSCHDYTIATSPFAIDREDKEYLMAKEKGLKWLVDLLEKNQSFFENGLQIKEIAKLSGKNILEVHTAASSLWNIGLIRTVLSSVAIGISKFQTWSIRFIEKSPQKIADALSEEHSGIYPDQIIIIGNGIDGPNWTLLEGWKKL